MFELPVPTYSFEIYDLVHANQENIPTISIVIISS